MRNGLGKGFRCIACFSIRKANVWAVDRHVVIRFSISIVVQPFEEIKLLPLAGGQVPSIAEVHDLIILLAIVTSKIACKRSDGRRFPPRKVSVRGPYEHRTRTVS